MKILNLIPGVLKTLFNYHKKGDPFALFHTYVTLARNTREAPRVSRNFWLLAFNRWVADEHGGPEMDFIHATSMKEGRDAIRPYREALGRNPRAARLLELLDQ